MTVSEQIIQVINDLCTKFGIVIDWAGTDVLPYVETLCKKLITYELITSFAWLSFCLILFLVSIICIKKLTPIYKKGLRNSCYDGWEVATGFSIAGLICIYIFICVVTCFQVNDIIKCIVFPEIYVFEYIQKMINCH